MKQSIKKLIIPLLAMVAIASAQEPSEKLTSKIEAMAKVGACYSPSFSPDGREIAFVSMSFQSILNVKCRAIIKLIVLLTL